MEANQYWENKIRYFSKFLGFDNVEDFQDTLDETNKSEILKRKGIQIIQNTPVVQSMTLPQNYNQETDKKWFNLTKLPFTAMSKQQLLKLTTRGTYDASKVMPWMSQDRCKINLKLYNIKKSQYNYMLSTNSNITVSHVSNVNGSSGGQGQYRLEKMNGELQNLMFKEGMSNVSKLVAILLLYREDIKCCDLLVNVGGTVQEYLHHVPVIAFSLLNTFCCSGALLPFLTQDPSQISQILTHISSQIHKNCPSSSFLRRDNITLTQFIISSIQSFWLNISQSKSTFRQKILYYLLINQVSVKAISRVCEASVVSLSRIINQGYTEKTGEVLRNPMGFVDREVFVGFLFGKLE